MAANPTKATAPDPWSTGIMAGASVANAALKDNTPMANQAAVTNQFDNSGWSVNLGLGTGASASQSTSSDKSQSALGLSQLLGNPLVLVLLAFVAFEFAKHR